MKAKDFGALVVAIVISETAGIIGSLFTVASVGGWYTTLVRPSLTPPSWVFGPVWTTLYALMGTAAFLVWRYGWREQRVRRALGIFGVQLVLNAVWSIVFFGLQAPQVAFIEIIFLWLAIVATMIFFARVSRAATWLLVPYLLWVSFAAYLNLAIWLLNT